MIRIGATFSEERKRKNLTLSEVANTLRIKVAFLKAIEEGNFKALPPSAYAHGFVRNYAKFLGLPEEKSLALFRREFDEKKTIDILPKGLLNEAKFIFPRVRVGKSAVLIAALFIVILGFLLFQYRAAIFNPALSIDSPSENEIVKSLIIEVKGKTDPNAALIVEGVEVMIQDDGTFKKKITVFPGNTTIDFKVENRFGRVTTQKRTILVKPGY